MMTEFAFLNCSFKSTHGMLSQRKGALAQHKSKKCFVGIMSSVFNQGDLFFKYSN